MKIVINATKEFIDNCVDANEAVRAAVESEDHDKYMQAIAVQMVYAVALINQLGDRTSLGGNWEKHLMGRDSRPHS